LANLTATTAVVTNLSSGNAVITGGYISGLANISATNSTMTNEVATNFSTGNAVITGGTISGLTNLSATTAVATNFSTGNAVITGGYVNGLANISATAATLTNVSSGNAVITGGYVNNLANIATTGNVIGASFLYANGVSILSGIGGTYSNANVASYLPVYSGTFNAATGTIVTQNVTNGNVTTLVATNFSTGNAVITGGYSDNHPIGANTAVTGRFSTVTATTVNAGTIGNTGATLTGTIQTAAQTNITSVGTLSGLTVSGSANLSLASSASILLNTGTGATNGVFLTGNILPSANIAYNLGSSSAWFNTFYGVSTQAKYADLAEIYSTDAEYAPGTVVVFGGAEEITVTTARADVSVAGVISTDPAYLMNSGSNGLPVALRGRVPVQVIGPVSKGDLLVTADNHPGYAESVGRSTEYPLAVFAKSIETNLDTGAKIITAVIL
jgi:hypothetical protein